MKVMLTAVVVTSLALSVAAAPTLRKEVQFVGFSRDESIVVWRMRLARAHGDGTVDELAVLRVVRTRDNAVLGAIRDGACARRDKQGKSRSCNNRSFAEQNPEWGEAQPTGAWQRLRRHTAMVGKALNLGDSTVRLAGDLDLTLEMSREADHIAVAGAPGAPIGYQPVARLLDGRVVALGHFREPAPEGAVLGAQVRVYFSPTGMTVAVLNRFAASTGDTPPVWVARAVQLPEAIGTTEIGAMRLAASAMRTTEDLYKSAHPSTSDLWDQFVGKSPEREPKRQGP